MYASFRFALAAASLLLHAERTSAPARGSTAGMALPERRVVDVTVRIAQPQFLAFRLGEKPVKKSFRRRLAPPAKRSKGLITFGSRSSTAPNRSSVHGGQVRAGPVRAGREHAANSRAAQIRIRQIHTE